MCCTSSNLRPENVKLEERTNSLGIAYNHAYSLLRAQGIIQPLLAIFLRSAQNATNSATTVYLTFGENV